MLLPISMRLSFRGGRTANIEIPGRTANISKDSIFRVAYPPPPAIVSDETEIEELADESIPLALACTYTLARRGEDGRVGPISEDEAAAWENARAVVVRETGTEGRLLVALIPLEAVPEPFKTDYETGFVSTPSGEFDQWDFQESFIRCDDDGAYVGNFFDPSWVQIRDARSAGCEPHIADIEALIELKRRSDQVSDQIDWRMFDISVSGETDGLTAEEALRRSRFQNEAPVHKVHGLEGLVSMRTETMLDLDEDDTRPGVDVEVQVPDTILDGWMEVRVFPTYLIDGVRAIFRRFLADRIGDTPIEEIVRIQLGRGRMDDICRVFEQEGFDDMGVSVPFAEDRVMGGGYSTSEVRNFRGNGCDIIVFEDFAGAYSYAWPEQIRADPDRKPRH
jgi:hypothetical protein